MHNNMNVLVLSDGFLYEYLYVTSHNYYFTDLNANLPRQPQNLEA